MSKVIWRQRRKASKRDIQQAIAPMLESGMILKRGNHYVYDSEARRIARGAWCANKH
jgi:hypothetical protein